MKSKNFTGIGTLSPFFFLFYSSFNPYLGEVNGNFIFIFIL
jgi:hypothetical protein